VHVVAALGDGHRDDPHRRVGHPLEHGLGVVRREEVVHERADHPGLVRAVRVLEDERVEAVLGGHDVGHPPVARQDADAADAPVEGLAVLHEAVEVHRLVGPVEAADAEVHDPGGHAGPVVRGHRQAGRRVGERRGGQRAGARRGV